MATDRERGSGRKVVIVSNTGNSAAIQYFNDELVDRGCRTVAITTDGLLIPNKEVARGQLGDADAVLFDDVNPSECGQAKQQISILARVRPLAALVVLVGKRDWHHISDDLRRSPMAVGRVHLHYYDQPMDTVFDCLAGIVPLDELAASK